MTYGPYPGGNQYSPFPFNYSDYNLRRDSQRRALIAFGMVSWCVVPIALFLLRFELGMWGMEIVLAISFGPFIWLASLTLPALTFLIPRLPHRRVPLTTVLIPLLLMEGAFITYGLTQYGEDNDKNYSPFVEDSADPDELTSLIVDISFATWIFALVAYIFVIVLSMSYRNRSSEY